MSIGEHKVAMVLRLIGVNYRSEFSFPGCRRRYDFLLPSQKIIIEVDGRQHFNPCGRFCSTTLRERQYIDTLKTKKALSLGYKVLRIDHVTLQISLTKLRSIVVMMMEKEGNFVVSNARKYRWLYNSLYI